jgi:hypothetical protein
MNARCAEDDRLAALRDTSTLFSMVTTRSHRSERHPCRACGGWTVRVAGQGYGRDQAFPITAELNLSDSVPPVDLVQSSAKSQRVGRGSSAGSN